MYIHISIGYHSYIFFWLEREKKQDLSDGEDVIGERLQQDVVRCVFIVTLLLKVCMMQKEREI